MCGRFAQAQSAIELARELGIPRELILNPRYNVAPTQEILI